ncbi:kinase-like domain-containing protein [Rhizophagus irregularis DAOM 181602=DAOM 197198]|uniref:Kinase-like domain-containing protein n=1 Tax=Rhizophagus irregularis (strain DAOM 181602 / DAOM 197198 / MUCL 43194) TaxID=747089 RepID=A0A2P4QAM6_RHIID|nr:kinase-like domain-containing protein [Rhizophagus irregularis DAOM 181602=DAOM 197198]POG74694.1 kinase-like domain-containing protein [Rhizophagus irregularis DAOM 181602=DAOM 197198]|eukprot:XP_025181560.1 kinase-like domain-containing protein [Rhizophagus irregularis DAOM 181602=DAOM 197198]
MSTIRKELVWAAIQKAYVLTDYNIHDDIDKRHKFRKRAILADKSLTKNEKLEGIKKLNKDYDSSKIRYNEGKRRFCEQIGLVERYKRWNSEKQQLKISKTTRKVILKKLENVEGAVGLMRSVYGNLPYIAREVIAGKEYTFATDIYSIAMIMWEISSGRPPFTNCEHNYSLAMDIVNGMRPKIISGTPLKYKRLMEQCWDADPAKRPSIRTIGNMIKEINRLCYRNVPNDDSNNIIKKLLKIFRVFKKTKKNNNLNKSNDEIYNNQEFEIPDN